MTRNLWQLCYGSWCHVKMIVCCAVVVGVMPWWLCSETKIHCCWSQEFFHMVLVSIVAWLATTFSSLPCSSIPSKYVAWAHKLCSQQTRPMVLSESGAQTPPQEIMKLLAKRWKGLSADEKEPFVNLAAADKVRYNTEKSALKWDSWVTWVTHKRVWLDLVMNHSVCNIQGLYDYIWAYSLEIKSVSCLISCVWWQ